jgi:hypothetical protein
MLFENGERSNGVDVVVIKFGFAIQHRFLSNRRGRRRERPINKH